MLQGNARHEPDTIRAMALIKNQLFIELTIGGRFFFGKILIL